MYGINQSCSKKAIAAPATKTNITCTTATAWPYKYFSLGPFFSVAACVRGEVGETPKNGAGRSGKNERGE